MPDATMTIRYLEAILTTWDDPRLAPVLNNGVLVETFCNVFVDQVAAKLGCQSFFLKNDQRIMTADEMCDFLDTASDWHEIRCAGLPAEQMSLAFSAIQGYANNGQFVVACAKSTVLNSQHGHICVVRPGMLKTSGRYGEVPAVANIGKENFIALGKSGPLKNQPAGVNEAFQPLPKFYIWKPA